MNDTIFKRIELTDTTKKIINYILKVVFMVREVTLTTTYHEEFQLKKTKKYRDLNML